MPAVRHDCWPWPNPHPNWETGEGASSSPNLTIPEMQSEPKNAPPSLATPGGKIEERGPGAVCATGALQRTRRRQRPSFKWCWAKSDAPKRRKSEKRWVQQKRRDVGRVSRKVHMRVFEEKTRTYECRERGKGERTEERKHPDRHDGATPPSLTPIAKPHAEKHMQRTEPQKRKLQRRAGNNLPWQRGNL